MSDILATFGIPVAGIPRQRPEVLVSENRKPVRRKTIKGVRFTPAEAELAEELRKRVGAPNMSSLFRGLLVVAARGEGLDYIDAVEVVPSWTTVPRFQIRFGRPEQATT